jgi:hypothetical protein
MGGVTGDQPAGAWLHEQAEVTCRRHGPMRLDFARDSYVCAGFDGEGCERYLHNEELHLVGLLHELERRGLL